MRCSSAEQVGRLARLHERADAHPEQPQPALERRAPEALAGGAPDPAATYVAMCHIFCDSVEAFQAGFGPHAQEILADIPNYTDRPPVIQISEVVVGLPGGR